MTEFFAQFFGPAVLLILLALALTLWVFRKRLFERGPRKGEASDPQKVKRQNPPDSVRH